MCATPLAPRHAHVLERRTGALRCACVTCERVMVAPGTPWAPVRRRWNRIDDFRLTDDQWRAFGLPIDLAFFFTRRGTGHVVVRYPSVAGTVECGLPLSAWNDVVAANAVLQMLEADGEALLVNRLGTRRDYFIASIDECYRLVGLIRQHWRGFDGGPTAWAAIHGFFDGS